ncbi:Uncharacterised protein [Mycobacteroides abscessus subsp. massiliense]|uniref:hypothetical protein n=1 Tax=Mycobacteroides abscessus TaxID=36809 RepID=UPI0009A87C29|nr:hypothetical protein [Mycobacteroides abscessus]SLE48354.1 Uncharacterised protein [Mycobacteroides abscessus subsp. massiliense]
MSVSTGYDERQALCCECGNLRTCRRPRNFVEENWYLQRPVDRSWRRELGDLKCDICGKVTTHALLYPKWHDFKDHAERIQSIALGDPDSLKVQVQERIRKNYRIGRESNPYLRHCWWTSATEEARKAGTNTVVTLCGDDHELPADPVSFDDDREDYGDELLVAPRHYRQMFSADAPPEGWDQQDCPDCARAVNRWILERHRKDLMAKLVELMRIASDGNAASLERLITAVDQVMP